MIRKAVWRWIEMPRGRDEIRGGEGKIKEEVPGDA